MGYADGYYYGQGRIICDTSTFSVGDTIRVRSMTDSSKVWNQQVATVGTALVFTVPCYDYYKICTVQNNTEIGGVYKTVDYGQTIYVDDMNKTTLAGIQNILNAHQESNLSIGDEVTILVNNSDWKMQIADIDNSNHIIDFVSKELYGYGDMSVSSNTYVDSAVRTQMQNFYSLIHAKDKNHIKLRTKACLLPSGGNSYQWNTFSDYVYSPNCYEVFGTNNNSCPVTLKQFAIFTTQQNRIREYGGSAINWWTCDGQLNYSSGGYINSSPTGEQSYTFKGNQTLGVLPCFRLTADS